MEEIKNNKKETSFEIKVEDETIILDINGKLNGMNSSIFEKYVDKIFTNLKFENLIFNFKNVEYISSSGLRVILYAQKKLGEKSKICVKNVNSEVNEIFQMTGFDNIVDVQEISNECVFG